MSASRATASCLVVLTFALTGCAHHLGVMRGSNELVIAGTSTANDNQEVAARKMLRLAARMTLNHGFRYFVIEGASVRDGLPTVVPGAKLTIRLYRPGEIDPGLAGLWDAQRIASGSL